MREFTLQKTTSFKIITPILLGVLLLAAFVAPLHALTPSRDLTGTWKNSISETYYEMDPSDPNTRMNDVKVTYDMVITQTGNSINIELDVYESSWITDTAYWNEYQMSGVPPVGYNQIVFTGTVSGSSFAADEMGSTLTAEHIVGTFTTDIITASLTGNAETTDTNGIIVLRSGSSATMPSSATPVPTPTPTPAPALPTSDNLGSVSVVQGSTWIVATGAPVTTQSQVGSGTEFKTGDDSNTIVGFTYPDQGGTVYLGANSDAGWIYLEPQTDPLSGNISYTVPPLATSFSEGIEPDEFGQAGASLAAEVAVGLVVLAATGAPITLTGALVVEGTLLLGTGIAYINEQLSPQEGTYDVRPVQVPQGLVMGEGTDYVVQVSNGITTIQVMDGSVIFVDQYTNNSITIAADQMLTLPPSQAQVGFSQQDLQSYQSTFDASSINQWWTQITPTTTSTVSADSPLAVTPTTNALNAFNNFLSSTLFLALIVLIIVIMIAAVLVTKSRKNLRQSRRSNKKENNQDIDQPVKNINSKTSESPSETPPPPSPQTEAQQTRPAFCPKCGKKTSKISSILPILRFQATSIRLISTVNIELPVTENKKRVKQKRK